MKAVNEPTLPSRSLQVVVEPAEQDLVRGQPQELFERLAVVQQAVKLRVKLDIDLAEQTATDNLPDETKDQVLAPVRDI